MVAVEAQRVVVRIRAPDGLLPQLDVAAADVGIEVPGGQRAVGRVRLDAADVLAPSLDDRVGERPDVRPDVDDDVGGSEA